VHHVHLAPPTLDLQGACVVSEAEVHSSCRVGEGGVRWWWLLLSRWCWLLARLALALALASSCQPDHHYKHRHHHLIIFS
jgi:hypothetical protein